MRYVRNVVITRFGISLVTALDSHHASWLPRGHSRRYIYIGYGLVDYVL